MQLLYKTFLNKQYKTVDNGYAFLMTLPVSYKEYVYEKYLFCIMGGVLPLIPAFAIIASIFIPFQLK